MSLIRKNFNFDGVNFECFAVITSDNKIYCKLKELADLLGYVESRSAYDLVEKRYKITWADLAKKEGLPSSPEGYSNWQPNTIFVSEPGIYLLMVRSKKRQAILFKYHIFEDVLPEIRKTGAYISPNITTQQLDNIMENLRKVREEKAEKDRLLEETRGKLAETDRMLEETREVAAEREKMVVETRKRLDENNNILEKERQQKCQLQNNLEIVRPKVAVIPDCKSVRHILGIFKHHEKNIYKCIRTQNRNYYQALRRIPGEFELVRKFCDVPNAINIINRLRELLPDAVFKHNKIISDLNVVEIIEKCIETEINRPIVSQLRDREPHYIETM